MQNFLLVPVCFPDLLDIVNSEIFFFSRKGDRSPSHITGLQIFLKMSTFLVLLEAPNIIYQCFHIYAFCLLGSQVGDAVRQHVI